MQDSYTTTRLLLNTLALSDAEFITRLLNTPGWIKFIGDRNIHSNEAAIEYIGKIMNNPNIKYWIVTAKELQTPIGIITFIKRDYLDHHDIGFAFLPEHAKQGYAHEAAVAVLDDAIQDPAHTHIVATTIRENSNSIQLLEKLGLKYDREVQRDDETLLLYSATTNELLAAQG